MPGTGSSVFEDDDAASPLLGIPGGSRDPSREGKGSSARPESTNGMAPSPAERRPSAIILFLKANWKWVLLVLAVAVFVMIVASD